MPPDEQTLKDWLKKKLGTKGLTLTRFCEQLAVKYHRTPEAISNWIMGNPTFRFEYVEEIGEFLGLTKPELMEFYWLAGYKFPEWILTPVTQALQDQPQDVWKLIRFGNMVEVYKFVTQKIDNTGKPIFDLTWDPRPGDYSIEENRAYEQYVDALLGACKRQVRYCEVMSFTPLQSHHVDRAQRFLEEHLITYNLRYYELDPEPIKSPPLMSFILLDEEWIVCCLYTDSNRFPEKEVRLAIQNAAVYALFKDYYDVIWEKAAQLKDGNRTYWETFADLKARFGAPRSR